jgi:diaminopimelate decarboxylase
MANPRPARILVTRTQYYQMIEDIVRRAAELLAPDAPILVEVPRPHNNPLPAALLDSGVILAESIDHELTYWRGIGCRRVVAIRIFVPCTLDERSDNTLVFECHDREPGINPLPAMIAATVLDGVTVPVSEPTAMEGQPLQTDMNPAEPATAQARLRIAQLSPEVVASLATPAYVYDAEVAVNRYRALREALGTELIVSLKANSLADLGLRCFPAFRDGVELASIGELQTAVGCGSVPRYVNNPSMDEAFMQAAHASGATFIVDSLDQARRLAAAGGRRSAAGVLLRLNPGVVDVLGARADDHFGMDCVDAAEAGTLLQLAGYGVLGVHCFAGSYRFSSRSTQFVAALLPVILELEKVTGISFQRVNLGGGFGERWEAQAELLAAYHAVLAQFPARWTLMHEAGRAIFAACGVFVTRVVATKTLDQDLVAVCDGGMAQNFLLAMTEGSLRKHKKPYLVGDLVANAAGINVKYAGSSCNRNDVIGLAVEPAQLPQPGTCCVFEDCGAYNRSYTVANFLQLPAAQDYLLGAGDA